MLLFNFSVREKNTLLAIIKHIIRKVIVEEEKFVYLPSLFSVCLNEKKEDLITLNYGSVSHVSLVISFLIGN